MRAAIKKPWLALKNPLSVVREAVSGLKKLLKTSLSLFQQLFLALKRTVKLAPRVPSVVLAEARKLAARAFAVRGTLWAVTRIEFKKKYAGSVLGVLWYPLYAGLLLGMYTFVFTVMFPVRFNEANFGTFDYIMMMFCGLVPYLGFSDAIATGVSSIKSNISLVKNEVFPVELIPVKHVLVSMAGLLISLSILLVIIAPTDYLGWHLLYLPVSIALLMMFTLSVVWVLSALAVLIPDLTYFVNLLLLFLIFVSPIAVKLSQLPHNIQLLMYCNPLTHLIESFRFSLLGEAVRFTPLWYDGAFGLLSLAFLCTAGAFFRRMMPLFSDYE